MRAATVPAFLIGVASRRVNATGAMAALPTGAALGLLRLIAELNKGRLDGWLLAYADFNFLHFAAVLFLVCSIVLVVASLLTPPPPADRIDGLTVGGVDRAAAGESRPAWRRHDWLLTVLLLIHPGRGALDRVQRMNWCCGRIS